jgi:nucleotide-binding universal stress UspA family protein
MFQRILVALERSDSALILLDEAIALAKATGASLKLLHVFNGFEEGYANPIYPGIDGLYAPLHDEVMRTYFEHWEEGQKIGMEWLKSLAQRAETAAVPIEISQQLGDPGTQICAIAQEWNADLILVGRRGRKGLTEFLLGSVSNYVLHHATCSVLTVQGYTTSASSPVKVPSKTQQSAVV